MRISTFLKKTNGVQGVKLLKFFLKELLDLKGRLRCRALFFEKNPTVFGFLHRRIKRLRAKE